MAPLIERRVYVDDIDCGVSIDAMGIYKSTWDIMLAASAREHFTTVGFQTKDGSITISDYTETLVNDEYIEVDNFLDEEKDAYTFYSIWVHTTPVSKVTYYGGTLIDLTSDTVTSDKLLAGMTAHDASGNLITGTMPDNGSISEIIDGVNTKTVVIPAGYTSGGTITVDDTVEIVAGEQADLIFQVSAELEGKAIAEDMGTCTVQLSMGAPIEAVFYTGVEDGIPVEKSEFDLANRSEITCLCGTRVVVISSQAPLDYLHTPNGDTILYKGNSCAAVLLTVSEGESTLISCELSGPT